MAKIVVLSSSQQELDPFFEMIPGLNKQQHHHADFFVGEFLGNDVCFGLTGVGMVNAASTATQAIQQFKPDLLMFSGVAGGMQPGVEIGDVVIATEVAQTEMFTMMAAIEGTPFVDCMINPHMHTLPPEWYVSADILGKNYVSDNYQIHAGRIVSTDQFPAPKVEYQQLLKDNVLAIDMETAAMYQVGWMMGVKSLAVRGISNVLQKDGSDPDMAQANVSEAPKRAAQITLQIIKSI